MKKYVFESLKFFCAAILCTILSAFATPSWGALPSGYTQLEYIESTGEQYIDTQYTMTNTSGIKIVIDDTATNSPKASTAAYFVGASLQGSYMGYFTRVSNNMVASVWAWNGENVLGTDITSTHSTVYINYMNDRKFIYNNGTRDYVREGDLPTLKDATGSLYLFNTSSGGGIYSGVGKMYSAQITENQSIVRNLVPAQRNSDGAVGMYDTVSGTFFGNKGSGEFVAGPEACEGERVTYTSATGTGVQNGTPTPINPIEPTFYKQGNMILRKVGDYADSYDATTGKITRRVGVKVFDGTEDWRSSGSYTGSCYLASITNSASDKLIYNTHFIGHAGTSGYSVGMSIINNNALSVWKSADTTPTTLKQYLAQQYAAGTPVTVWYPLATETTEDWPASYCEKPIKIATTKYNESAFGPLNTALQNAISVVDTVVSNTITQAGKIATLQAQKQTRPNDIADDNEKCPAYKQCLLVEDENGAPHWYEITDPFRDFVAPIIANNVAPASTTNQPGFTQLEYIQSTGTQWIDTGIKWRYGYSLEIAFTPVATGVNTALFGASNGSAYNSGEVSLFFQRDGYDVIWPTTSSAVSEFKHFSTFTTNTRYVAQYNNSGIIIGQDTLGFSVYSGYVGERNIFLFATNRGEANSYPSKLKIHSTRIWNNNGELVRNFVPVKRNSDGAIGMYDTVTKTFFANAGTGTFTAGPNVANTDVPANGTWTATWAANATTGVAAGTITGEGLCNAVAGTDLSIVTQEQISSSGWSNNGANCWCRVTSVSNNDGGYSVTNSNWVYYSSSAACTSGCAGYCDYGIRAYPAFRQNLFGM